MLKVEPLHRPERRFYFDVKWLFIFVIVAFMLIFQVFPLIYMVYRALFSTGTFSLDALKRIYTYDLNWVSLKNTLIGATLAMLFGTLIAFPLAWLVGRTNMYGRKLFRSLFVLTYMVPPYLGAMAWLRLLNPKVGNLNVFLRDLLGLAENPFNIYTLGGLVWVLTSFYYPYAFITISRAMEKMDPSLEEASRASGASPLRTLLTVTLPMMTPSIVSGAMLVFVSAASCFGIPSIVAMPGNIYTVTTRIVNYVSIGSAEGLTDATCLALFLMLMAAVILYSSDFIVGRKQYITVSGKSTRPNIVDLGKLRIPITLLVAAFAFVVIILPFGTVAVTSITKNLGKSLLAEGNFTLKHWQTVLSRDRILQGMRNSLSYAAIAATAGILIACVMAYLLQRTKVRGRRIPDFLITLGSGSPSVVIALGLIMTMTGRFGINIYNTMYIMIVAYLIKYQMMGMRTVVSAMSQIHVSLEESSQVSGASWLLTMRRVTLPLIGPSIAAGWFLIFIPSFYELSMSTLLYSSNTVVIGVQLHEYWTFTSQQQASAMAFGILIVVVVLNFILSKLTKGNFSI
ncbi:iron ABC transporter permease [Clostridia bacterium]|nr:iron ABC transporter permease [Clostridia bacterium]